MNSYEDLLNEELKNQTSLDEIELKVVKSYYAKRPSGLIWLNEEVPDITSGPLNLDGMHSDERMRVSALDSSGRDKWDINYGR